MVCPIDNRLFRDAVKTPCCEKAYCEECIQTQLLEHDFVCPNCQKRIASLDKLIINKPLRTRVGDYIDRAIQESRKEAELLVSSGTPTHGTPTAEVEQVRFSGFGTPLLTNRTRNARAPRQKSKTRRVISSISPTTEWTLLRCSTRVSLNFRRRSPNSPRCFRTRRYPHRLDIRRNTSSINSKYS